ncbi:hypothetical protein F8M41_009516 [Gigaspora margarita]|uniref:Uncharacterized protein n=1 Tax=Gigaspora margarita TaxID=4874 RepID=A0A8H3X223_GIGMA|nr:hypothetical protein F8M41_009516 [Gigaspora margarita]
MVANNFTHIRNNSKPIKLVKQKQKDHVDINEYYSNSDINEYYSNSEFSAKTILFKNIKFRKVSKHNKSIKINSNIDLNSTYAGSLDVSNTDNISDEFAYISIELDESNNISNSFDHDPISNLLDEHETTLHENQEFSNDFLNNSAYILMIFRPLYKMKKLFKKMMSFLMKLMLI